LEGDTVDLPVRKAYEAYGFGLESQGQSYDVSVDGVILEIYRSGSALRTRIKPVNASASAKAVDFRATLSSGNSAAAASETAEGLTLASGSAIDIGVEIVGGFGSVFEILLRVTDLPTNQISISNVRIVKDGAFKNVVVLIDRIV
jgi:hypothetical protein